VGLLEEGFAVTLGVDQGVELLNLITQFHRQGIVLELAGVAKGFHRAGTLMGCSSCSSQAPPVLSVCMQSAR
jgi:hypothetical protein